MSDEMRGLEVVECAKINFDNLGQMMPQVKMHPMFIIAMEQLETGITRLTQEEDSRPCPK